MGTQLKDVDMNMEDSGNSCGSSVVSDFSGPSDHTDFFDGEGDDVQVSDLEGETDSKESLNILQVSYPFYPIEYFIHAHVSDVAIILPYLN